MSNNLFVKEFQNFLWRNLPSYFVNITWDISKVEESTTSIYWRIKALPEEDGVMVIAAHIHGFYPSVTIVLKDNIFLAMTGDYIYFLECFSNDGRITIGTIVRMPEAHDVQ